MKKPGILLLGVMLVAQPVAGQIVPAPRPLGTTEWVQFGSSSQIAALTYAGFNTRMGPYAGKLIFSNPTGASMSLVCVDYGNHIGYGQQFNANVTNIGLATTDADMANTRLAGSAGSLLKYKKAAYLASMFPPKDGTLANEAAFADLHWAIWTLMSPGSFGFAFGGVRNWLTWLDDNPGWMTGFDFTQWSVLSDVRMVNGVGGVQEQVVRNPSAVPEPETYVLLLSGLLFLAFAGRRRLKEQGYI